MHIKRRVERIEERESDIIFENALLANIYQNSSDASVFSEHWYQCRGVIYSSYCHYIELSATNK